MYGVDKFFWVGEVGGFIWKRGSSSFGWIDAADTDVMGRAHCANGTE